MFYCGIDVAKHNHKVVFLDEHGQVRKAAFTAENNRAGMDHLERELAGLGGEVRIALEATGHYWLSLYDVLTRQGYPVTVINPLQIAAYRKSGLRKVKNDRTDAVWFFCAFPTCPLPAGIFQPCCNCANSAGFTTGSRSRSAIASANS